MKNTTKTLALTTAVIGLATVIKRVQKQSYSANDSKGITTILADGSNATLMRQTADKTELQFLFRD